MMKKLYFCETNGYNMVASVDSENECRYLTETNDFPVLSGMDTDQKGKVAHEFLATIEDDSSWDDDCTYDQIFADGVDILAKIEKEI